MNSAQMLLWILGTTLFAFYLGASYWGEHQRRDELASSADARRLAAVEWMHDAQAGPAVLAVAPSERVAVVAPAARTPEPTRATMWPATASRPGRQMY